MTTHAITTSKALPGRLALLIFNDPYLKSKHSKRQYQSNIEHFEAWRAAQGSPVLTKTLVESYVAHLQREGLAPRTIKQKVSSIMWLARKMMDMAIDYLPEGEAQRTKEQAARVLGLEINKLVKGNSAPSGRHLRSGEVTRLLRTCLKDPGPAGVRDAALFAVAWTTGLRRTELAGLSMADLELHEAPEGLDADLIVRGKGEKVRSAYLFNGALQALLDWLELRGEAPGPIFIQIRKNGRIVTGGSLSGEALRKVLEKRQSEISIKHLTWHDFRRTFAGNLFDAGNDTSTVQQLMGHADPGTTTAYDRRPELVRKSAVRKLVLAIPEVERP